MCAQLYVYIYKELYIFMHFMHMNTYHNGVYMYNAHIHDDICIYVSIQTHMTMMRAQTWTIWNMLTCVK